MKKHVKLYLDHYGYTTADVIPCEKCGAVAVDIHHVEPKGMGGNPDKDVIENLMAVCRDCHSDLHGIDNIIWYSGNKGCRTARSRREASVAGEYNPNGELATCKGCGCDTTNPSMLCDRCEE